MNDQSKLTAAQTKTGSALDPVLDKLNQAFPDGATGAGDAKTCSQGFLRQAAFARERLLEPENTREE